MSSARPWAARSGSASRSVPAGQVLAADELPVRVVRELEHQIRPGQESRRDRKTGEELMQHRQTVAGTAPPRNRT